MIEEMNKEMIEREQHNQKRIMELNKENEILKEEYVMLQNASDKVEEEKDREIERLNNIINEFDKWLLGEQMMFYRSSDNERLIRYGETKNKWLELKGDDKK